MKPIDRIRQGDSLPFSIDLGGESIDDWTCTISWKQYPEDIAQGSRVVTGKNRKWEGFLTSTETNSLTGGLWYLVAVLENSTTDERIEKVRRFNITQTWEGGFISAGTTSLGALYLSYHLGGIAEDEETILSGFNFDQDVTITSISLFARQAPTGDVFTIDLLKNTLEQSKTASIPDGEQEGSASVSGLTYTSSDEFGIIVKNVGSTFPGGEIDIKVHYSL